MKKGAFITIYGINNLGKTTHATILSARLKRLGFKVEQVKYPIYSIQPTGEIINTYLRSEKQSIPEDELQLWYVLNRYQYQSKLKELLKQGYFVIAEDYSGTGMAWGIAKGLDPDWIISANKNLLVPDLSILFEGQRQLDAREKVHIHEQNNELMERCKKVHQELAEKFDWRKMDIEDKIEDTSNKLWGIVKAFLLENNYISDKQRTHSSITENAENIKCSQIENSVRVDL